MTNKEDFEIALHSILDRLGKADWAEPLLDLDNKFLQVPEDDSFRDQLLNMLLQLRESTLSEPAMPLSPLAAIRLSHLTCWNYRFIRVDDSGRHYLDPLTEPAEAFRGGEIDVQQSNSAYPAQDIVKRWARDHLC